MTGIGPPAAGPGPGEQDYRVRCDAASVGIVVQDGAGRIVYANPAAQHILSLTADQMLGRAPRDLPYELFREDGQPLPAAEHPCRVTLESGRPVHGSVMGVRTEKSPDTRWLLVDTVPISTPDGGLLEIVATFQDVTAQRVAEMRVRESEHRFRTLVESSTDLVWEVDENLRYTYLSPRLRDVLGFEPAELLGASPFSIMPPEEATRVRAIVADAITRRLPFSNVENVCIGRDGGSVVLETSGRPVFDDAGRFWGYRGIDRDITARKTAELTLQRERDFVSAVLDTVAALVLVLDRQGRILRFNRACEQMTGYRSTGICGEVFWERLVPQEDVENVRTTFDGICSRKIPAQELVAKSEENIWVTRDGRHHLVSCCKTVLLGEDGEVEHVILSGVDITASREADETLQRSEEFIRIIADFVPVRIAYVDPDLRYQFANQRHAEWLGLSKEEVLGRRVEEVVDENLYSRVLPYMQSALAGREVILNEFGVTVHGESRVFQLAYIPHSRGGEVLGIIAVIDDITQRKHLEQRLFQAQKMEAVGTLAGGVAHDFNNLLTVITGYSEILLERLGRRHPLAKDLGEISKAAARAADLTRQLLAFSRKQILQPQILSANTVLLSLERTLGRLLGEQNRLELALATNLEDIYADPAQIEQMTVTLAVNAREAMPDGGRFRIETSNFFLDDDFARNHPVVKPGRYVRISVSDTGKGMGAETLRHVFEPFFTTKGLGRGTGLGLSTVYGIVKQSGGYVWVESEAGAGARFDIYFPVAPPSPESSAAPLPEEASRHGETILLVEDEPAVRRIITETLTRQQYKVLQARSGEDALALAMDYSGPIHLLLSDVVLPGIGGPELGRQISALRPGIKRLYISGYAEHLTPSGVLDTASGFLQKPFRTEVLLRRVREQLDTV